MSTILITGAGTGFGRESAMRLAEKGHAVIAAVEIFPQIFELEQEAKKRGIELQVEKLDVTNPKDREKAWKWDIDILLNNAGVAEGGSVIDIPEKNLRHQFEVNVFGTILLTQGFARTMVDKKEGKIIFMSSIEGLVADPFSGPYAATKHALEAFASSLHKEVKEFGIQVATINPGPYLTGFNDRMYETWKNWEDNPSQRVFDYEKLAFPHMQLDSEPVYDMVISVVTGKTRQYRNLVPKAMRKQVQAMMAAEWELEQNSTSGKRDNVVEQAYKMKPGTAVKPFILNRILGGF
ncbi:SDR family oxidoreductase [Alkanindiges sp. WGS2144]|uniref:SDR family oxidoreductase n=1 Tax=Alkanindiges sp. WGS2144 TaxID=3366808 RepID=UPI0037510FB7